MRIMQEPMNVSTLGSWLVDHHYDLEMVPEFWRSQEAPSNLLNLTLGSVFLALCLINNLCCLLIFVVYAR